ncbi:MULTISPECIES: F0F1 ATP synthase subunit gamma [Abyssibacter]|uniref:ATP synthase gamma chain n=1 Tax=Abyssibacter profundi TaxID=2182787 RepID=A0A363UJC2_9GAMM|nr:F0F1 ATP synthase subunit gamma [Abyssibacter profundi]MBV62337.1 F0F1 ATP synthase subunit gamma [Nevskiales bacterium]MEC9406688.1 F0F1 ATP synthase subunit gamma [Pseudomonadota bacterium]PWN55529.1 F0F1 ATP synthase subunit gamma [Abyssibacter profundi]
MAVGKEIKGKIRSVKNTQKITKAMEMVAASKMRKAQDRQAAATPYAERIRRTIGHLAEANPDYKHPFLVERPVKRVGIIVVSTDRGLCGGLNINLFRQALGEFRAAKDAGAEVDLMIVGSKGMGFFKRVGGNIVSEVTGLGDTPHLDQLIGPVKVLLDKYRDGELDKVVLIHNRFVNTMTQKPTVEQLLPVQPVKDEGLLDNWDYIYEPSAEDLLDGILMRYVEAQVYGAVAENVACEMAARMIAMKSASDNAGQIIDDLQLEYNKARQAAITQELAEIVGGAAAV